MSQKLSVTVPKLPDLMFYLFNACLIKKYFSGYLKCKYDFVWYYCRIAWNSIHVKKMKV